MGRVPSAAARATACAGARRWWPHPDVGQSGVRRLKRVLEREAAKKEREAREAAERKAQEEAENAASKTKGWFS